jgi:hypothetical protein
MAQNNPGLYHEDLLDIVNTPTAPQKSFKPMPAPIAAPVATQGPAWNIAKLTGATSGNDVADDEAISNYFNALKPAFGQAGYSGDFNNPNNHWLISHEGAEGDVREIRSGYGEESVYSPAFKKWLNDNQYSFGYRYVGPEQQMALLDKSGNTIGDINKYVDKPSWFERVVPLGIAAISGGALAGPLLGALGVAAPGAISTGIASGAISGGINAGIQGGDVLKGILTGGLTGGVGGAAAPLASSAASGVANAGGPAWLADAASGAVKGAAGALPGAVISGNYNDLLTGALAGGVGSGVSNVVGNVLPDNITGNANVDNAIVKGIGGLAGGLAKAGITGGNVDVVNSLIPAVAQGISDEYKLPLNQVQAGLGIASKVLRGNELTPNDFVNLVGTFGTKTGKPDAGKGDSFNDDGFDDGGDGVEASYPADTQTEPAQTLEDLLAQVEVTGQKTPGGDAYVPPVPGYDGAPPPISQGQEQQQVELTGKTESNPYNPVQREVTAIQPPADLDLGNVLNALPKDVTIPDIKAGDVDKNKVTGVNKASEKPIANAPTESQNDGFDLASLMMLLGMGGKESKPLPISLVKGLNFDPNSFYQDSSSGSMDDLVRLLQRRG